MYHIGEQPETLPEQFELDEDEEEVEINYFGRILRVEDDDERLVEEQDPLLQCYSGELDEGEYLSEVILDSGADASLLPLWLAKEGTPLKKNSNNHGGLQDAQGNRIPQKASVFSLSLS